MLNEALLAEFIGDGRTFDPLSTDFLAFKWALVKSLLRDGMLVEVEWDGRVVLVGDLHGDLDSLLSVISRCARDEDCLTVFLGDYVDRGPRQLLTLIGALAFKAKFKDRVVLLRGNHEDPSINAYYGFLAELRERYGARWRLFYRHFVRPVYLSLPVAALIEAGGLRLFAVHGGLPIDRLTLDDVRELPREEVVGHPTLTQLLWNDPREELADYAPSMRGEGIFYFGFRVLERFLRDNGISAVVRAHEPVPEGFRAMFGGRLYTVFTCRYYGVPPTALEVGRDGSIKPVRLDLRASGDRR